MVPKYNQTGLVFKLSHLFILLFVASIYGCAKDNNEALPFTTGTYYGIKTIYYPHTQYHSTDTMTIKFEGLAYSYTSSSSLDFGRGSYRLKIGSIEFTDSLFRIQIFTWDWIMGGTFKLKAINDSLILYQNGAWNQTTCRLHKVTL